MTTNKRVAIIGGGTGGLGTLKAILDLPEETRRGWQIDLFEQRDGIGGIWHPQDPSKPNSDPDGLPETPVYPTLKLNTVHPTITFPQFPFPKGTPLLPHYSSLAKYHTDFATKFNLWPHIQTSSRIVSADYSNEWKITIDQRGRHHTFYYDHLLVAHGHNHYPREPEWSGRQSWLNSDRRIQHSIFYKDPLEYSGETVVVVGFGSSGWDITRQVLPYAKKTYHSFNRDDPKRPALIPPVQGAVQLGLINNVNKEGLVMADGTVIPTPGKTTIIVATGYQIKVPFIDLIKVDPSYKAPLDAPQRTLTNNLALIRPLHRQIFAIDDRIPRNALGFIGLPVPIANGPSSYAQGLFAAHGIADDSWLPDKETMLTELEAYEQSYRDIGYEVLEIGHRFIGEGAGDRYQEELVAEVARSSSIPVPDFIQTPYMESWRKWARAPKNFIIMNQAWHKLEALGLAADLVKDAETEEDWEKVLEAVFEWGKADLQQEAAVVHKRPTVVLEGVPGIAVK